jgi:hypothetical protein
MESFLTTVMGTGVGIVGTLLVQQITRRLSRRDQMLSLRKKWASDVLDGLSKAWSEQPFDPSNIDTFLAPSPPRELDFVDPTANRIHIWLSLRLHVAQAALRIQQQVESARPTSAYLVYDEEMHKTRPLLAGWAVGKRGHGARAVERWVWAANADLDASGDRRSDSKELRRIARRHERATRVRP